MELVSFKLSSIFVSYAIFRTIGGCALKVVNYCCCCCCFLCLGDYEGRFSPRGCFLFVSFIFSCFCVVLLFFVFFLFSLIFAIRIHVLVAYFFVKFILVCYLLLLSLALSLFLLYFISHFYILKLFSLKFSFFAV